MVQARGIEQRRLRHNQQFRPIEQRTPDFPGRSVEGRIGAMRNAILCGDPGIMIIDNQTQHTAVLNQHALRHSRGAGCIHHISRHSRRQLQGIKIRIATRQPTGP